MFGRGLKLVAGMLIAAVVVTIVPAEVFTATEADEYSWGISAGFSAGAHHTIGEAVVLPENLASEVVDGDAPLVAEAEETVEEVITQRIATITSSRRLNVRSEASTSSKVLTKIASGKRAVVLDESIPGWIKVQYNNTVGYISSEYASVTTETYVVPTGGDGQAVVDYAVQFVGNPYKWGGSSLTNGIDCSNFVMRIYEAFGVSLPHSSYSLRSVGYEVSASEIQPGDIVCYSGHVAIYIGNGQIVHAANKNDGIKISPKWNYTRVITIRRIF